MAATALNMATQVDRNYEAFKRLLPEILSSHAGKFAVMHDEQIVEYFDSLADAVRFGNTEFGDANFSIQEVTSQNINLGYYSYALHNVAH
jgi:hypothetical protein